MVHGERLRVQPIRIALDRLERITVCTRPFRAAGPRIEAERLGEKLVVHNYGHGGSGWSLSWGSASMVVPLALEGGVRAVGVIGCGALGLTAALLLQRAGVRVTIYAKDPPEMTRSARATGSWTPDARVALAKATDGAFCARWEAMARFSWARYGEMLGLPEAPVERHQRLMLSDVPPAQAAAERVAKDALGFAFLEKRLGDLYSTPEDFGPGEHPFATAWCQRSVSLRFHLGPYIRMLEEEFLRGGGVMVRREFAGAGELQGLAESVIVNCTGYGARALFGDESLIPVRGQIAWLPAQPEVPYSVIWDDLNVVPRRDGTVVQLGGRGSGAGWNDASEVPDEAEAELAIRSAGVLFARGAF